MMLVVDPSRSPEGVSAPPTTLGDLIYAKAAKPASERDWTGLVQAVAAGDQDALHTLYEQTYRIVFTLSMRITGNRETAEEVTLDVFHDVWRRASAYDPATGSVVAWIMNQTRSRAIDRLRLQQRKKRVTSAVDVSAMPSPPKSPLDVVDASEQERLIREAVQKVLT